MPVDWKALIDMVAPLGGALASGDGNSGHFMSGWQHGASVASHEKLAKQQLAMDRRNKGEAFKLDMVQKLMSVDDPFVFQQMKDAASHAGQAIHGMDPASWQGVQFPESKSASKQLKELNDILGGMAKRYNLDDLAADGNNTIQLHDGQTMPIASAMDMVKMRPQDATGKPIAAPKKAQTPPGTESERAAGILQQIEVAKDAGDAPTVKRLEAQYKNLLKANTDISGASRKPGDPVIDELNTTLKQLQIDSAKSRLNQPPPGNGVADARAFKMEETLAKNWQQMSQSARTVDQQYAVMQSGLKRFRQGDKNGGSQAVLVTFQKILDPTSVVRESEYARTAVGQSLLNRLEGYTERLAHGGAGMTEGELSQMVQTAGEFVTQLKSHTAGQRQRIENQAKKRGLDLGSIFDDIATGSAPPNAPAPSATGTIRARDPQGKLHEAPAGTALPAGWRIEP